MKARLGDTVFIRFPEHFVISEDLNLYWDQDGRPLNKDGSPKYSDDIKAFVLDTSEKVESYNNGTFKP